MNDENQAKNEELNVSEYSLFSDEKDFIQERNERKTRMFLTMIFSFSFVILVMASATNPEIYKIDPETLIIINQAFNAAVLLVIPFLLGSIGAVARILMSGTSISTSGILVVSSGLMAMFSWIGIKSGVLLAVVAPHLDEYSISTSVTGETSSSFYTMALVAILVGMFSSNLYLFINQRVELLTQEANAQNPNNKN